MESNQPSQKDNSSQTEKSTKFLIEQYHVLSDDRINHNELFWNVPMMFLTAQSFLLVIALGGFETAPWLRAVGAFISFVFGFLSIQIFERNRINEITDAEQMLDIEKHLLSNGYTGTEIHLPSKKRKYLNGEEVEKRLDSRGLLKNLNRGVSYQLWKRGMLLVICISVFLMFYNFFTYIDKYFPHVSTSGCPIQFNSFEYFISTLDKSAVSIVIVLIFTIWVILIADLIIQENTTMKNKRGSNSAPIPSTSANKKLSKLKLISRLELLLLAVFVLLSMIFRYLQTGFPEYIWEIVLIIFIIIPTIYIIRFIICNRIETKKRINSASKDSVIAIILAGGTNQRLRTEYPGIVKFVNIRVDNQALLINTLHRNANFKNQLTILTLEDYKLKINGLLGNDSPKPASTKDMDVNLVTEPSSKGTATAIYFYLWRSYHDDDSQLGSDPILMFFPSDHVITDIGSYTAIIAQAIEHARIFPHIYLIGNSQPTDSSLYGYIQVQNEMGSILRVERFMEKPASNEITELKYKGAVFCNMGIFIARRSIFMRSFIDTNWPSLREFSSCHPNKDEIKLLYNVIPDSSFEKDVLEKISNLYVIPAAFDWIDVGDPDRLRFAEEKNLCQVDSNIS